MSYTVAVTAVEQESEDKVGAILSEEVRGENWYVLKMDVPSCSPYKFVVTAFNKAGASDPSEPVTGILPTCKFSPTLVFHTPLPPRWVICRP